MKAAAADVAVVTAQAPPASRPVAAVLVLAGLVAALLLLRAAILLLAFDDVFTPGYELFPMGVLGHQILLGLPSVSIFEFHDTHSGGQILSAVLSAASFALFGTSYVALKLVPVLFALGTLVLLYVFVLRRFGLAAAAFAGALLVFGPASYVDYSTANYGNHSEVLFFVVLALFPLWSYLVEGRRGALRAAAFGLTCGLAVWYALSSLLVVVLFVAFWFCRDGFALVRRGLLPWLAGFAVGTLPITYVMVLYEAPQAKWMGAKFADDSVRLDVALERFGRYWADLIPSSATFYDVGPLPGDVLDGALAAFWYAAVVYLVVRCRGALGRCAVALLPPWRRSARGTDVVVVLLAYPLALGGAYAFSNFKIGNWAGFEWAGYRYLLTLFLVFDLLLVMAFVDLRRRGWRRLAGAGAVAVVGIGLLGNLGHRFDPDQAGKGLHYPGYFYPQMGRILLLPRYAARPDAVADLIGRMRPQEAHQVWEGLGICHALVGLRRDGALDQQEFRIDAVLKRFPEAARPFIARGIGMQVAEHRAWPDKFQSGRREQASAQQAAADRGLQLVLRATVPEAPYLVHGLFLPPELTAVVGSRRKLAQNRTLLQEVPVRWTRAAWQGHGMFAGHLFWRGIPEEVALVRALVADLGRNTRNQSDRAAFLMGLGYACEVFWDDPSGHDERLRELVAADDVSLVYVGIGWMTEHVLKHDDDVLARLPEGFPPDASPALTRGLRWRGAWAQFVGGEERGGESR